MFHLDCKKTNQPNMVEVSKDLLVTEAATTGVL